MNHESWMMNNEELTWNSTRRRTGYFLRCSQCLMKFSASTGRSAMTAMALPSSAATITTRFQSQIGSIKVKSNCWLIDWNHHQPPVLEATLAAGDGFKRRHSIIKMMTIDSINWFSELVIKAGPNWIRSIQPFLFLSYLFFFLFLGYSFIIFFFSLFLFFSFFFFFL